MKQQIAEQKQQNQAVQSALAMLSRKSELVAQH
jgi:hypothetical protein